ncbi:MAG TPA: NIPSNAP family protein [Planctomycetaceae bacterium]|nr:NIPSNAP family protein [Planctomycetaceae bacterium]
MTTQHWFRVAGFATLAASGALVASLALGRLLPAAEPAPQADAKSGGKVQPAASYVYELRTYVTLPGRLPALHQRFREHTLKLFEKHGMKNMYYFTPLDKDDTLIYLLAHESREAAQASWDAFRKDPEWLKARDASERDGKIVMKVESVFLESTDYSPRK